MYKDIERKRANRRKWMRKWRKANPELARQRGRECYDRAKLRAKEERLFSVSHWNGAKNGAIKRGLSFEIEREEFKIPYKCPALGIPLDWETYDTTPSLDRIDNNKGYVPDNVVVVSRRANRLKASATVEELKALARFYGPDT